MKVTLMNIRRGHVSGSVRQTLLNPAPADVTAGIRWTLKVNSVCEHPLFSYF